MKKFERRRASENFYKSAIAQVEKQGFYLSPSGEKIYDTVEHLRQMMYRVLRRMV